MEEEISVTFRDYSDLDYGFIYNLKKVCFKNYVEKYYGGWNEDFQKKYFDDFILHERENIKIIMANKKVAGFTNGKKLDSGEYEIGNICIVPEFRGKGIGTKLLSDLILMSDCESISLRVFKDNIRAKKLYEKLGFKQCGETGTHYLMKYTASKH